MRTRKMSTTQQTFNGLMLPPEAILADDNIRFNLKASRVDSLAADILEQGRVLVPIEVEPLPKAINGAGYRVTDGHYRHAATSKLNSIASSGAKAAARKTCSAVSAIIAPTITTSPCAKLIRPRMPYTMV